MAHETQKAKAGLLTKGWTPSKNCLAKALSLRQSYILGRFRLLNKEPEQKPLEGNDTVCVFFQHLNTDLKGKVEMFHKQTCTDHTPQMNIGEHWGLSNCQKIEGTRVLFFFTVSLHIFQQYWRSIQDREPHQAEGFHMHDLQSNTVAGGRTHS